MVGCFRSLAKVLVELPKKKNFLLILSPFGVCFVFLLFFLGGKA